MLVISSETAIKTELHLKKTNNWQYLKLQGNNIHAGLGL